MSLGVALRTGGPPILFTLGEEPRAGKGSSPLFTFGPAITIGAAWELDAGPGREVPGREGDFPVNLLCERASAGGKQLSAEGPAAGGYRGEVAAPNPTTRPS